MQVLIGGMVCPVIAAATGLNIKCTGTNCPAYDRVRNLCDVGERTTCNVGRIIIEPVPGLPAAEGYEQQMRVRFE